MERTVAPRDAVPTLSECWAALTVRFEHERRIRVREGGVGVVSHSEFPSQERRDRNRRDIALQCVSAPDARQPRSLEFRPGVPGQ